MKMLCFVALWLKKLPPIIVIFEATSDNASSFDWSSVLNRKQNPTTNLWGRLLYFFFGSTTLHWVQPTKTFLQKIQTDANH
mmetsp:Transcript_54476/g.81106  ORF Transcript_54476/g.81106 Transcript_54476/m.81106 type:complete len:81 (+) Transcript_54476:865-1107(+)